MKNNNTDQLKIFEIEEAPMPKHLAKKLCAIKAKQRKLRKLAKKPKLNQRELAVVTGLPTYALDDAWLSCVDKLKTWQRDLNCDSVTFYRILRDWAETRNKSKQTVFLA